MKPTKLNLLILPASLLMSGLSSAATLVAIADNTLLRNNNATAQASTNFGGRSNVILGATDNAAHFRYGIFRFDVTTIAAQITAGTEILSATLTLTEDMSLDANHGTTTRTFSVHGITAANTGWVEGTANGTVQNGSSSLSYRSSHSTVASATDWASGGATPTLGDLFTFGTDTGAAIGTASVTFATLSQQTLVFNLNTAALTTLLGQWQSQGITNAGLAIQQADSLLGQTFWESKETAGTPSPATLNITFVPEPSTALLGGLGLLVLLRRRRN